MNNSYQNLITCDQLNTTLKNENLIVLDASIPPVGNMQAPKNVWPQVTIPKAQRFDINEQFSDLAAKYPHTMIKAKQFELHARKLGINKDSQIVVYDNFGIFSSARAWYMFRTMGHRNVAVLQGGLPLWQKKNYSIENQTDNYDKKILAEGNFIAKENTEAFCDKQFVLSQLEMKSTTVLDARSVERFLGQVREPRVGVRSGHMPGAYNLPYTQVINEGVLSDIEVLNNKFQAVNKKLINKEQPLIMSCGSGVTACVLALAAEMAGYKNIRVYDGSWSEWGSIDSLPVTP